ncbi:MAG: phosphoribosylglycinamide formyltransferase [Peptococcaceae bacterium]|nr:phosphoribosylglycinamide formyltransferase [Peptococcaceae bacterium]
MNKIRLGVLVSGRGSNLQNIIDQAEAGKLMAQVAVVISDKKEAYALERARQAGIPAIHVSPMDFPTRDDYDSAVLGILRQHGVELVCLAGYMRIVSQVILEAFPNRVINIHPSLLPSFPGLRGQAQALAYGVRYSGCTLHFVDEGMDTGPIILQAVVPVYEEDTVESLSKRILEQEHRLYTEGINLYAQGRLKVEGRKVYIKKL